MVLMCYSFYKHLRSEARELRDRGDPDFAAPRPGAPSPGQAFIAENPTAGQIRQSNIVDTERDDR
jgi:hypothetical protein